jgi:GTP-binding protein
MPEISPDGDGDGEGSGERASLKRGHILFAQECTFLRAVSSFDALTQEDIPEIAFAGRSNVGKSSVVNALLGRKAMARVSNTPGRTREIVQFDLGEGRLRISDLPGYGFARVSKAMAANWHRLIETYLHHRPQLRRICLLMDSRHPPQDSDLMMMNLLDGAGVTSILVLTKLDKLNATERERAINDATKEVARHASIMPEIFATSAQTGEGIAPLRAELARVANPAEKGYKPVNRGPRK